MILTGKKHPEEWQQPLDLKAVEARLEQGPAWIADILKEHLPTDHPDMGFRRCACGLKFHYIDAKAWHRHAAAMVWNALQEDALLAILRETRAAAVEARRQLRLHWSDNPNWRVGNEHLYQAKADAALEAALAKATEGQL